ncbi:MAG: TldD/PmbA family protein [Candidatus Nitrosotenuis sp.]
MSICDDIVSYARRAGADECEAVFCSKRIITVRVTDSEIAEVKETEDVGAGTRVICGKRISSSQSTTLDSVYLVDAAIGASHRVAKREFWKSFPADGATYHPVEKTNDTELWHIDAVSASDIAQEMINSALHPKVTSISGSLNIVCEEFEIMNTSGLKKNEKATYIAGIINCDGGEPQVSGIGQSNSRTLNDFNAQSIGFEAARMCVDSQNPRQADHETTCIIFEPMAVGEILTFVVAPNFSLKTYSEGRSCFSEKIGSNIAADKFNLTDWPLAENSLGGRSFDDEGYPTKNTQFVKDGIFCSTYSDSYNAFKEGFQTSGNACRLGSPLGRTPEPIPTHAPHNLTVEAGNTSRDEIIKDTKNGLIVSRLWYTYAVNPIQGDFSCTARSGIWSIRNGEIVHPTKQVRIIHNLKKMLQNITAIADNQRTVLSWAANPVTAPTIRCDGITISPI